MSIDLDSFKTVRLRRVQELDRHARRRWLFRGHSVASYELRTSFERCCDRHEIHPRRWDRVEHELQREFRRVYHHYSLDSPALDARAEWMALMQHHGAPTRLLDFTYSIHVAAYFAVENGDGDAAIWAVDGSWATRESAKRLVTAGREQGTIESLRSPFDEGTEGRVMDALFFAKPPVDFACPLNPFRLNERLRTQKGVFLAPGHVRKTFMENLAALPDHDSARYVKRIVIPKDLRRPIVKHLYSLNITHQTLFPGLDGFARALGVYHPCFESGGMISDYQRRNDDP